jgi:hypothetical protein
MEVIQKGKTIFIRPSHKLPVHDILRDGGIILALVWAVFGVLVLFFDHDPARMIVYFAAITLLVVFPLAIGLWIKPARHKREVVVDGNQGLLLVKSPGRRRQFGLDKIKALHIRKYRCGTNLPLHRLEVELTSGRNTLLIGGVRDEQPLVSVGQKMGEILDKPFELLK